MPIWTAYNHSENKKQAVVRLPVLLFFLYSCVATGADHIYHLVDAFLAKRLAGSFHHDPDHRLSAGFPDENSARIAQLIGNRLNGLLHLRIVLCFGLDLTRTFFSTWG